MADFTLARLEATGIVLLGTIRADGWPRISPCEAYIVDGDLMLGMMWQSHKALDLLRDPRLTIATPQADREPVHGDLKLYGSVFDVPDPDRRRQYGDTLEAAIKWRPSEPYHLFAVDIERAGFISFGEQRRLLRWSRESGIEVLRHPDDAAGAG
ncbi:MAG: pyridoxamine 5'-phosphate oxidase family protein [Hyphomicrobiales bacterium]